MVLAFATRDARGKHVNAPRYARVHFAMGTARASGAAAFVTTIGPATIVVCSRGAHKIVRHMAFVYVDGAHALVGIPARRVTRTQRYKLQPVVVVGVATIVFMVFVQVIGVCVSRDGQVQVVINM